MFQPKPMIETGYGNCVEPDDDVTFLCSTNVWSTVSKSSKTHEKLCCYFCQGVVVPQGVIVSLPPIIMKRKIRPWKDEFSLQRGFFSTSMIMRRRVNVESFFDLRNTLDFFFEKHLMP